MGILEALQKSKDTMKDKKMTLLMLEFSFIGWLLGAMLSEMLFSSISVILALVASQFIQLCMATYLNASCASFFLAASVPDGMLNAQADAATWLKNAGMGGDGSSWGRAGFGSDDNDTDEAEPAPDEDNDQSLGDEPDSGAQDGAKPDGDSTPKSDDPGAR